MKHRSIVAVLAAGALVLAACGDDDDLAGVQAPDVSGRQNVSGEPFVVTSGGVVFGALAPEYGVRGPEDAAQGDAESNPTLSPPLKFLNAPEGTKSYALLMEDPDSVPVVGYACDHWLAANITTAELAADASLAAAGSMVQGMNYLSQAGYTGPAPPAGTAHVYVFTVWALDTTLDLENGYSRSELEAAMEGHILASAEMTAEYKN